MSDLTERTDHYAEAVQFLAAADNWADEADANNTNAGDRAALCIQAAQVHATLALVEKLETTTEFRFVEEPGGES